MSEMDCIDLEARFPKYVIGYDDPSLVANRDPWNKIIVGRSGHISANGGDKLLVCTNGPSSELAKDIKNGKLPCRITQHGDDGINAEFDVQDVELFLDAIKAKRK